MIRGAALSALTVVAIACQGTALAADRVKITNEAIRLAQIGALKDFNNLPSVADQLRQFLATEAVRASRASPQGAFKAQFLGGSGFGSNSFVELAKISYLNKDGVREFCTGIFLDSPALEDEATSFTPFRVLTAGHCSCGRLDSYQVYRGDNHKIHDKQRYLLTAPPDRYRGYSCESIPEEQIGQDLALLRLGFVNPTKKMVEREDPAIAYAKIASMHQVYQDGATRRLIGVGFGRTENAEEPEDAVAAIIPIASFFCGADGFAASACAALREFVLADLRASPGSNPPDSCGGDSGAPIFWVAPSGRVASGGPPSPAVRYLVGITSRALDGVRQNRGTTCGGGGIYTAVGHPDVARWLSLHGILVRSDPSFDLRTLKDQIGRARK